MLERCSSGRRHSPQLRDRRCNDDRPTQQFETPHGSSMDQRHFEESKSSAGARSKERRKKTSKSELFHTDISISFISYHKTTMYTKRLKLNSVVISTAVLQEPMSTVSDTHSTVQYLYSKGHVHTLAYRGYLGPKGESYSFVHVQCLCFCCHHGMLLYNSNHHLLSDRQVFDMNEVKGVVRIPHPSLSLSTICSNETFIHTKAPETQT